MRAETCGGVAHFDGGFGHAVEGFAAGFCRGAFGGQVGEDGGRGADGVFDVLEGLSLVSLVWTVLKVWGEGITMRARTVGECQIEYRNAIPRRVSRSHGHVLEGSSYQP